MRAGLDVVPPDPSPNLGPLRGPSPQGEGEDYLCLALNLMPMGRDPALGRRLCGATIDVR